MWLSLRTDNPTCYIQYFYLPGLNTTLKNSTNNTLVIELKLENGNKDKGIYYDAINLTFYDFPNKSHLMGNYTIPGFYQGHKKKATRLETVDLNKTLLSKATYPNGTAKFRVDLATAVRFKIMAWKTKRHKLDVGSDVDVNNQGSKTYEKKIKLRSGASDHKRYCAQMGALVSSVVLVFLDFWWWFFFHNFKLFEFLEVGFVVFNFVILGFRRNVVVNFSEHFLHMELLNSFGNEFFLPFLVIFGG